VNKILVAAYVLTSILFSSCSTTLSESINTKKRDPAMRTLFLKQNPCPSTHKNYGSCPGYIVDHVIPLKRGGPDRPDNMQWQTVEDAKQKDKWE
jgi:hypothetical protein